MGPNSPKQITHNPSGGSLIEDRDAFVGRHLPDLTTASTTRILEGNASIFQYTCNGNVTDGSDQLLGN